MDDNPAIRDAYNAGLPKVTQYRTELAQNLGLYEKFKALRASGDFEGLSQAQRKSVENDLRDYRLGGAELAPEKKRRFAEIQAELAALEAKFSENLLDATNAFSALITERGELAGIPEDVLVEKFGLRGKHVAAEDEHASDLSVKAAERLLAESGVDHRAGAAPAERKGATARLPQLRGIFAGAEDGRVAGGRARLPQRSCRKGAAPRAQGLRGARGIRPGRARVRGTPRVGHRVHVGKTARGTLRVLRPGSEAVFPGAQSPGGHVPAGRDPVRHTDSPGHG